MDRKVKRCFMNQEDIKRIKVGKTSIGIIGMGKVMEEMAERWAEKPDNEIRDELIRRISKRNYVPGSAKADYAKALFREFKKFLGKPYEQEAVEGIQIKILGPGCIRCDGLEQEIITILAELNLPADVEHVREIKEIGKYGVMGTPALIINGAVKAVGNAPPKIKLIQWLKEAQIQIIQGGNTNGD